MSAICQHRFYARIENFAFLWANLDSIGVTSTDKLLNISSRRLFSDPDANAIHTPTSPTMSRHSCSDSTIPSGTHVIRPPPGIVQLVTLSSNIVLVSLQCVLHVLPSLSNLSIIISSIPIPDHLVQGTSSTHRAAGDLLSCSDGTIPTGTL